MNREWVIAGIVALLFHGLLLFGFRLETAAAPLPAADVAVDVSLVAAAPAPEAPAEPPSPEPVQPPPPIEPPPVPVPAPEPSPEAPPIPAPPEQTIHHEPARPAHPNAAASKAARPAPPGHGPAVTAPTMGAVGPGSNPVRARFNPKPPYPPEARRLHQEGRVLLEVQVGADGRAVGVNVKHSSGSAILDSAAVQGVQRWTFEPARVAGLPVAGRADVPVVFSLSQ